MSTGAIRLDIVLHYSQLMLLHTSYTNNNMNQSGGEQVW